MYFISEHIFERFTMVKVLSNRPNVKSMENANHFAFLVGNLLISIEMVLKCMLSLPELILFI